MDVNVKNTFKSQFERLPKELRDAVTATDLRAKLFTLTQKYHLHIDKAGTLENEVVLVLMGMELPSLFVGNIQRELELSPENANALAKDVNEQIFHPIHEQLINFLSKQEADLEKESAAKLAVTIQENLRPDDHVDPYREATDGTTALRKPADASFAKSVTMPSGVRASTPSAAPVLAESSLAGIPPKKIEPAVELPKNIVGDKLGASLSLRSILGTGNAANVSPAAPVSTPAPQPKHESATMDGVSPAKPGVPEAKSPSELSDAAKNAALDPYRESFS